jgi:hypothetical protein
MQDIELECTHHASVDLLPQLERFDRIYLWMDNDAPGQQGSSLGRQREGDREKLLHLDKE